MPVVGGLASGLGTTDTCQLYVDGDVHDDGVVLVWIGLQFRKALREYYMDNQDKPDRYPRTLEELTDPKGQLVPKRYLRRVYIDPMTGTTDWGVVRSPGGGILGVYSKAAGEPRKKHGLPKELESFDKAASYREWLFAFDPAGLSGKATP